MRHFFILIFCTLLGVAGTAVAQDFNNMSASELLLSLRARIVDIKETERVLSQNTAAAQANRDEANDLRSEDASLETRSASYDREVASHNAEVNAYNEQCIGSKLPEDEYTVCLSLKQNLDLQKARLDADGDRLQNDHQAYNSRVRDLNDREVRRAEAAVQLLAQYERLDLDIRTIQLRLYDIAVARDQSGFAETVRQCTKRDNLDAVYTCMSNAFNS